MAQLPYELMDPIRNGGLPAYAGGQQLPYALLDPITNGGMPVLYQPKPSRIMPGMVSPFAPIAEPQAGDIPDQRARAQRYMRGQDTPMASNATDFPVQQGALYRPGDETLSQPQGQDGLLPSAAQAYASNLFDQGKNYPTGVPQPWNMPNSVQGVTSDYAPGVTLTAGQPDTTPVDMPRQMPASPSVGIPQPPVAFNTPDSGAVAGNNYTSGSQNSPNSANQPGVLAQPQQQPESNAMMMGLLAAGLGILANNTGNYGQAGPAIGKGGLMGVQTYLSQKKQEQEMAMAQAQMSETKRLHDAQIGNYTSEGLLRDAQVGKIKDEMQIQKDIRQATQDLIKRYDTQNGGKPVDQMALMNNPQFHRDLAMMLYTQGKDAAAKQAMATAGDLIKLQESQWEKGEQTLPNDMVIPGDRNKLTGEFRPQPGAVPIHKFSQTPLVTAKFGVDMEQEKEYSKKAGGALGDEMAAWQKGAIAAPTNMARFERLGQLLQQAGTGKYAGTAADLKAAAKGLGIDLGALGVSDNVAPAQAAQALARAMALELRNPTAGAGMPGSLSDADRNYLESMIPTIEKDPKAWPIMLDTYKKLQQRNVDVARLARAYEKAHGNQMDWHFIDELEKWTTAHPIFGGQQTPSGAGGQPGKRYNPATDKVEVVQ